MICTNKHSTAVKFEDVRVMVSCGIVSVYVCFVCESGINESVDNKGL